MSDLLRTIKFLMRAVCVLPGMAAAATAPGTPAQAGMLFEADLGTIVLVAVGLIAIAGGRAVRAMAIFPERGTAGKAPLTSRNTPS
jgi:hypothetical protein